MSLNKSRKLAEKRRAAGEVPPLEPPWPYRLVAFDPWFYGVEKDAEPDDE